MVQTSATYQYFEATPFAFFQILEHIRARDGDLDADIYEYQPPQLVAHFL
jgi:hypothetical protein